MKRTLGPAKTTISRTAPRGGLWKKVGQYLFGDFSYVDEFGATLDYEAYWKAQELTATNPGWQAVLAYKWRFIAGLIEQGSTVLDLGCGDGSLLAFLRQHRSVRPYGLELSQKASELARQKGLEVIEADLTRGPVSLPQVDYIIISEVLEHIPNPEAVLLQVRDRFNKRLIVDVPNTGALNDRLRLLLGRFPKQWVFHPGEHLRFWTVSDFLTMSRQLGFRTRAYGLYAPPYQFAGLKLWRWYPRLFSRYVLYVMEKA